MKINWVGIIAGLIILSSLTFPWWTLQMSIAIESKEPTEESISVYPYQIATQTLAFNFPLSVLMNLWFGWAALVLIIAAGVAGIIGGFSIENRARILLLSSGILSILSMAIFAVGIQSELAQASPIVGFPVDLFSKNASASIASYYYYYDIGFWIALIGAIVAFVSLFGYSVQGMFKRPKR